MMLVFKLFREAIARKNSKNWDLLVLLVHGHRGWHACKNAANKGVQGKYMFERETLLMPGLHWHVHAIDWNPRPAPVVAVLWRLLDISRNDVS